MGVEYGPPDIDLLSFVFENGGGDQSKPVILPMTSNLHTHRLNNLQVLIDASDASRYVTPRSARKITRQLIAGLRAEGLRPGDCVCIHSFNDVCTNMALGVTSILGMRVLRTSDLLPNDIHGHNRHWSTIYWLQPRLH